jgi:cation transport ATPase
MGLPTDLQTLSLIPGRIRLHLPGWKGDGSERIENRLRRIKGVESVQANPLTENVLVHFNHPMTDKDTLLRKLGEALDELVNDERPASADGASVSQPANNDRSLIRVGVRGLLGHAVVDSLWFGAGLLGSAMGLPLAGLGPLHVLMDIAVWTMAFAGDHSVRHPQTSSVSREAERSAIHRFARNDKSSRLTS